MLKKLKNKLMLTLTLFLGLFVGSQMIQASEIYVTGSKANDAVITTKDGIDVTGKTDLNKYTTYNISYHWTVPNAEQVKNGDTTTFELPDNVQISYKDISFPVKADNGDIIGRFEIKKGAQTGILTFNDYFEKHNLENIKGNLKFSVNGTEGNESHSWNLNKAGWLDSDGKPTWSIVYNPESKQLTNVTLEDTVSGKQKIDMNSIELWYGHVDQNNQFIADKKVTNPVETGLIDINGNVMTAKFDTLDQAIQIVYTTTPTSEDNMLNLTNYVESKSDELGIDSMTCSILVDGSGSANGSIKPSIPDSGEANPSVDTDYINYKVTKSWDTTCHPTSVTIHLYANGKEVDTQILNEKNDWTYEWKMLPTKDKEGNKIHYTVKEDPIEGYNPEYHDHSSNTIKHETIWVPATQFKDGEEFIITCSNQPGDSYALEAGDKRYTISGDKVTISKGNAEYPTYITNEEATKLDNTFVWKSIYVRTGKIDHLNGIYDLYNLESVRNVNKGLKRVLASLQGARDMVEKDHGKQKNCQWFYGFQGNKDKNGITNPKDEWGNIMGGANFYYILDNGHTGDGNKQNVPIFYLYQKKTITVTDSNTDIVNHKSE